MSLKWPEIITYTVFFGLAICHLYCIFDGPFPMILKQTTMFVESEMTVEGI